MGHSTYANRGQALELYINYANSRYQHKGTAMMQKIPTEFIPIRDRHGRISSVKVEHKSTVDYIGRYGSYPVAMEAKNTNQDTIRWDAVQEHQAEFLDSWCQQPGTIGLVLVSFNLEHFYAIPWTFWGAAYDLRVRKRDRTTPKRISAFEEVWDIPKKNSAREEDLSPLWRIPDHDRTYGLNYLQNAQKYIISV